VVGVNDLKNHCSTEVQDWNLAVTPRRKTILLLYAAAYVGNLFFAMIHSQF
jgi:hypothetical protein